MTVRGGVAGDLLGAGDRSRRHRGGFLHFHDQ